MYTPEILTKFDEIYSKCPSMPLIKWRKVRKDYFEHTFEQEIKLFLGKENITNDDRILALKDRDFLSKNSKRFKYGQFNEIFGNYFIDNFFLYKILEEIEYYTEITPNLIFFSRNKEEDLTDIWIVYNFLKNISSEPIVDQKIFLFPIDLEKKMNSEGTFGFSNVNSGVCINFSTVIIWRKEEMTKVLCHEMIHMLHLDYVLEDHKIKNLARKMFKINKKCPSIPNESITDSLTFIFMSYLNAKKLNLNPNNVLNNELKWTCQIIYNIWKYLNVDDIVYETDIISYYFLKSMILFKLKLDPTFIKYLLFGTIIGGEKNVNVFNKELHNSDFLQKYYKFISSLKLKKNKSLKMSFYSNF